MTQFAIIDSTPSLVIEMKSIILLALLIMMKMD